MDKYGNEGLTCGKCGEPAVPGSEPPLCERHLKERAERQVKEAAEDAPSTLKELSDAAV